MRYLRQGRLLRLSADEARQDPGSDSRSNCTPRVHIDRPRQAVRTNQTFAGKAGILLPRVVSDRPNPIREVCKHPPAEPEALRCESFKAASMRRLAVSR